MNGAIALIARREVTEFVRDGRLLWAGGLVLLLTLAALAVGWQQQRAIDAERIAAQALDYDDWVSQTTRHPHDAAHQGMHVFKPEPPLSIVDPGIGPYVGSTIWLQAHRQSEMKFRPAQDATGLQRFGNLSVAWVLQILGPLLVIVLGFNAFAGEREQGTLRQTLSLGVPASRILWGKALALGGSLALLLAPIAIVAVLAMLTAEGSDRADTIMRFGWIVVAYLLYFATTIFLVLAVSARASSSRLALIVLLGAWIAGVTLAPRLAADLARLANPSPNRIEFNSGLDSELAHAQERAWTEEFGVGIPWSPQVPLNKWGRALELDDHTAYGVIDKHFTGLWDSFDRQQRVQEWPGLVLPLLALRGFSMGFAGTDFAHHRDFSIAAEQQRRLMQNLISHDLVEHADPLGNQHFSYKAGADLWKRVPRFTYTAPSAWHALQDNARSLAVLVAGCVLAALLALAMTRRPLMR